MKVPGAGGVHLETLHLPGPSPAIVFVHGGLGSVWNPYPQLHAFDGRRELVTYSLAGNGESTAPEEQTLQAHVADLHSLVAELGLEAPLLHGHSYGVAIALEYAKRHPIHGLVLHGGADHGMTPAWERALLKLFMALRLYRLPTDKALMRQLAERVGVHEATPRAVIEDFLKTNPTPQRRSAWETVTEAFWGYDGRDDLDRIEAPALVIHGPADGVVPAGLARETAERLPRGHFHLLSRTGYRRGWSRYRRTGASRPRDDRLTLPKPPTRHGLTETTEDDCCLTDTAFGRVTRRRRRRPAGGRTVG
ncbi:MAG: alpha/beta fold hydrolase [Bradymonadaceae bacterium]